MRKYQTLWYKGKYSAKYITWGEVTTVYIPALLLLFRFRKYLTPSLPSSSNSHIQIHYMYDNNKYCAWSMLMHKRGTVRWASCILWEDIYTLQQEPHTKSPAPTEHGLLWLGHDVWGVCWCRYSSTMTMHPPHYPLIIRKKMQFPSFKDKYRRNLESSQFFLHLGHKVFSNYHAAECAINIILCVFSWFSCIGNRGGISGHLSQQGTYPWCTAIS